MAKNGDLPGVEPARVSPEMLVFARKRIESLAVSLDKVDKELAVIAGVPTFSERAKYLAKRKEYFVTELAELNGYIGV